MGGEGEMFIPDIDLQIAKVRYVVFTRKDPEKLGVKIKLVKEIK